MADTSWCNEVGNFSATDKTGKNWNKLENNAWEEFSGVEQLSPIQLRYIQSLWAQETNLNRTNDKNENYVRGKMIFFDQINLGPTWAEMAGYPKTNIPDNTDKAKYLIDYNGKKFQSLPSHFYNVENEIAIRSSLTNGLPINSDGVLFPIEDEFKLSWMRRLVENGIEGQLGPFYKDGKLRQVKIDSNSLDRFILYSYPEFFPEYFNGQTARSPLSLGEMYLLDFLEYHLERGESRNAKTKQNWLTNPFAKPDIGESRLLLNNLKNVLNMTGGKQTSLPGTQERFVITDFAQGSFVGNKTNRWREILFGQNGRPVERTGVLPSVDKNYQVKGWIDLPIVRGGTPLPWSFIWKYVVREGVWQKKVYDQQGSLPKEIGGGLSVVEYADTLARGNNLNNTNYVPYNNRSNTYLSYDVRSRFWSMSRYSDQKISHRELLFYIRSLHGMSGVVPPRYVIRPSDYQATTRSLTGREDTVPFPTDELNLISQCGGIPETGYKFNYNGGVFDIKPFSASDKFNIPRNSVLRSRYVTMIHSPFGYPRYTNDNKPFEKPIETNRVDLFGKSSEVVNHTNFAGYYSLSGGSNDRSPFVGLFGYKSILDYKKDAKTDVQKNHIPLNSFFNRKNELDDDRGNDKGDRYETPDSMLTSNNGSVYYQYHKKQAGKEYSKLLKNVFSPGLFSEKELQFLYELVSYVYYGKLNEETVVIPSLGGQSATSIRSFTHIWNSRSSNINRWSELGNIVSVNIKDPKYNITTTDAGLASEVLNFFGIDLLDSVKENSSFLMDYILWAAPTWGQVYKKKYSDVDGTFINRFKKDSRYKLLSNPGLYPFHFMADNIIKSENSSRPLVPAWVHHNHLSRRLNIKEGVDLDLNDIGEDVKQNIERVLGDDIFGQTPTSNTGRLISLPRFVLGGRPDINGDEKWDTTWGKNPFSINKNGEFIIGNLDDVLDNWAKNKTHNGKYVSAMEILFWVRAKRGLATAPKEIPIEHFIPENVDFVSEVKSVWPKEVGKKIFIDSRGRTSLKGQPLIFPGLPDREENSRFLPTETLHNIPILTSYYFPIITEGLNDGSIKRVDADPLIDLKAPPNPGDAKDTAIVGWNSRYVAKWQGANDVDTLIEPKWYTSLFSTTWPDSSNLNSYHVLPYKLVLNKYLSWENKFGWKKNPVYGLVTGFDKEKEITISSIQSWFKAMKCIQADTEYAIYLDQGLRKKQGEKDSVVPVIGKMYKSESDNNPKDVLVYISGEPEAQRGPDLKHPPQPATDENIFTLSLRRRPWYLEFTSGQEDLNSVWLSDTSLGTKNCQRDYRYMRHIIQPFTFPYTNAKTTTNPQGWYSAEQIDALNDAYKIMWQHHSKFGKDLGMYINDLNNRVNSISKDSLRTFVLSVIGITADQKNAKIAKSIVSLKNDILGSAKFYSNWGSKTFFWAAGLRTKNIKFSTKAELMGNQKLSNFAESFDDFKRQGWDIVFPLIKFGLSQNLKPEEITWNSISLGRDYILTIIQNFTSDAFKHAIEGSIKDLIESGAASELRKYVLYGVTGNLIISIVFTLISLEIDYILDDVKIEQKLDDLWNNYLNKASISTTDAPFGYLEGPYLQTKGLLRIPKGANGIVPIQYTQDENGNIQVQETPAQNESETNPTPSKLFKTPVPFASDATGLKEYITEQNELFKKPGGKLTEIKNSLNAGTCECEFLLDLISEDLTQTEKNTYGVIDKGTVDNPLNQNRGIVRRAWKAMKGTEQNPNRVNILDEAPIFSDNPFFYDLPPRPNIDTKGLFGTPTGIRSAQVGPCQEAASWVIDKSGRTNVYNLRVNGQNGVSVRQFRSRDVDLGRIGSIPECDCPRFFWPTILTINPNDDLCQFIAMDGGYPSRPPEVYYGCDRSSAVLLANDITNNEGVRYNNNIIPQEFVERFSRNLLKPVSKFSLPFNQTGFTYSNDVNYKLNGNGVKSMYNVAGVPAPHEREIVKLFRMKHGIDVVDPRGNCCSLEELNNTTKNANINDCTYIIKLNTKAFKDVVKEKCGNPNNTKNKNQDPPTGNNILGPTVDNDLVNQSVIAAQIPHNRTDKLVRGGWSDPTIQNRVVLPPCLPGMDCISPPTPPGIKPIQNIIREGTTVQDNTRVTLLQGAAIGSIVGRGVGSTVGVVAGKILTPYFTPDRKVREEVVEIIGASTPLNPGGKTYLLEETWESAFGRQIIRRELTPNEARQFLLTNRVKD